MDRSALRVGENQSIEIDDGVLTFHAAAMGCTIRSASEVLAIVPLAQRTSWTLIVSCTGDRGAGFTELTEGTAQGTTARLLNWTAGRGAPDSEAGRVARAALEDSGDPASDAFPLPAARTSAEAPVSSRVLPGAPIFDAYPQAVPGEAACPSCGAALDPVPKRGRDCRDCSEPFHVRTCLDDVVRILSRAASDELDDQWAEWHAVESVQDDAGAARLVAARRDARLGSQRYRYEQRQERAARDARTALEIIAEQAGVELPD